MPPGKLKLETPISHVRLVCCLLGKQSAGYPGTCLRAGRHSLPAPQDAPCSRVCWGHKKVRVWGGRLRVLDLGVGEATKKREGV